MPADACLDISHGNYGLALDAKSCHVWHTTNIDPALVGVNPNDPNFDPTLYTGEVVEMNQYGNVLNYWPHGRPFAQGVVVDGNGNAWVAHSAVAAADRYTEFPGYGYQLHHRTSQDQWHLDRHLRRQRYLGR